MAISKYNAEGYYDSTAYEALSNIEMEENRARFRPVVYICSPYAGGVASNDENALRYCRMAYERGYLPIAPHLYFPRFLNADNPSEREDGLFMGRVLLTKCMEIWVFGETVSSAMAQEITKAVTRGMSVRYFTENGEAIK